MSASSSLDNPPASIWHIKYEAGTTGDMLSGSDGDTFATGITDWYPRVRPDQYFDLDAVCPANEWSDKLLVQTQTPVVYHHVKLEIDHCSTPAKRALTLASLQWTIGPPRCTRCTRAVGLSKNTSADIANGSKDQPQFVAMAASGFGASAVDNI